MCKYWSCFMEVKWCKNCLNVSTRPRITFDERGWCNACRWMEERIFMVHRCFMWINRIAADPVSGRSWS